MHLQPILHHYRGTQLDVRFTILKSKRPRKLVTHNDQVSFAIADTETFTKLLVLSSSNDGEVLRYDDGEVRVLADANRMNLTPGTYRYEIKLVEGDTGFSYAVHEGVFDLTDFAFSR